MMAFRPESVVSAESVEAESAEVSADASVLSALLSALSALLSVDEVSLVSVADVSDVAVVPERHGPAARNVHSCYRRHAEENDDQHDRDKGSYTLFHLQVPPLIFLLHN